MCYLVLLETSGNQAYLFATNRLRQNVGASELTWASGSRWVLEEVGKAGGPRLWDSNPKKRRDNIAGSTPIGGYEIILATSGKALIVVNGTGDDAAKAKALVGAITKQALRDAPGLEICGAIAEVKPGMAIHQGIAEVEKRFEAVRNTLPSPSLRFLHLPVVAPCVSSGLPANRLKNDLDGNPMFMSNVAWTKHDAAEAWKRRLQAVLDAHSAPFRAPKNLDRAERLFQEMDWVSVVHADGNGMGQTFANFHDHCGCADPENNSEYINRLRRFSLALDEATEKAFIKACEVLPSNTVSGETADIDYRPIVPLVLGGDDLTVILDGRYALAFTNVFLEQFERATAENDDLNGIAKRSVGHPWFGAAAGVAIVKPHFPFHTAYDLAESLLRSAKSVKRNGWLGPHGSALDFHVLFDASYTALDDIRRCRLKVGDTNLYAGPYVTSKLPQDAPDWAWAHHIDALRCRIDVIKARDPDSGRSRLPNGQLHALRNALFQGREVADGLLKELLGRYGESGLGDLCDTDDPPSFFRRHNNKHCETRFLDALTSAPFWLDAREAIAVMENHDG